MKKRRAGAKPKTVPRPDSVLLIGFGAPEMQADVPAFIAGILAGRRIPESRIAEVAKHYEAIGGGSPYNRHTFALQRALSEELAQFPETEAIKVRTGMRQWHPYLADAFRQLAADGSRSVLGIVLAPHRCEASFDRYVVSAESALRELGRAAPTISWNRPWHNDPLFAEAVSARAEEAFGRVPAGDRAKTEVIFTAHSIPAAMAAGSDYVSQLGETCALVAAAVPRESWTLVYQSRSGSPQQPWLEPDILDHLDALEAEGAADVVVAPIGFVSEHMEVVYDLDSEARERAAALGLGLVRAGTAGTHPAFVRMIRELVEERVAGAPRRALGGRGPRADVCAPDCCPSGAARPVTR